MSVNYQHAGGDLRRRSQELIGQAVGRGTGMVADRVEHYTNVMREVGDILRERGEPQAADFTTTIAERVTGMARYLRNTDGSEILSDLGDLARGRTWLLTGLGFVGGLAMARAVRTSADFANQSGDGYRDEYAQPYSQYAQSYREFGQTAGQDDV